MKAERRVLFLSLRPEYADLILSGGKTVELRRKRPMIERDEMIILYASSPIKSILGVARVRSVVQGSVNEIWRKFGRDSGITKKAYEDYFDNAVDATAITLNGTKRLSRPRSLHAIREIIDGFAPPQSFRYLTDSEGRALIS